MFCVSFLSRLFCVSLVLVFGFQWERSDAFGKPDALLMEAAAQGMPEACCNYGIWLTKQAEKSEDKGEKEGFYKKAFGFFKRAIDGGSEIQALRANWAYMLEHGLGGEKNEKEAFEIYRQLKDEDFLPALLKVAVMTELGIGTDQNDQMAEHYYKTACEQKLSKKLTGLIQYKRGMMYLNGWGVTQSEEKACICFDSSEEKGFALAGLMLVELNYQGRGTDKGYKKMAASVPSWPLWAREFAGGDLLYKVAILYKEDSKPDEMVKYYKKAAKYGQPEAVAVLNEIYKDAPIRLLGEAPCGACQAKDLYGLVYHPGHLRKQAVMDCYTQFSLCLDLLESKNYREAINLLSFLINNDHPYAPAYFKLGQMCELGWGVTVNRKKARVLYIEAAKLQYPVAQQKVSRYFKAGSDIKKHLEQASVLGSLMDDIEVLYKYQACPLTRKQLKEFKGRERSISFDKGCQIGSPAKGKTMVEACEYIRGVLRQLNVCVSPGFSWKSLSIKEEDGINASMKGLEIAMGKVSIEEPVERIKAFLTEGEIDTASVKHMLKGGRRSISLQELTAFEHALDKIIEDYSGDEG